MVAARRNGAPLRVAHGDAVSALVTAEEAQRMLDDGRWAYHPDAEECARTVIAQSTENDRLTGVIADAAASLDGVHLVACARWVSVHAPCDCIVGRVRATLAKAVQP